MYIELKNINKSFGDFQASKDVNFAIEKGKLVGLVRLLLLVLFLIA